MNELSVTVRQMFQEKKDIVLSIICGFIGGITAVGLFSASGYLISKAALAPPIYTLMVLVATVKLFGIISALSRYGERYFSHRGTFTMLSHLRVAVYEKIEPQFQQVFRRFRSGDMLARIVGDVETLQNFFLRVFYPPIVLCLVFLMTIFFTTIFSIVHALIIFAGFLLTTVIIPLYFSLRQQKVEENLREKRGDFSTEMTELFFGFRDLKIHDSLDEKEALLENTAARYGKEQEKTGIHQLYRETLNAFISLIISVVVLATGIYMISDGELDGIFLAMLLMISLTVFENTTAMAVLPGHLEDSRIASKRLLEVTESGETVEDDGEILELTEAPTIEMRNVSFRYDKEARNTLENINLVFPKGSKTAIVGPSGSGKSTILYLLLRFEKAQSGEISINGKEITKLNQESIWEHANVVLQENHFFYGTIRDNLRIAREDLTDEEMLHALKKVDLESFQLDDPVLEKGANLSGGEKQRLAISRAMLKNSFIWLLDEPTSSLDSLTGAKIYDELYQLAKEDTLILISHRLEGLEKMDQIIVIEDGQVVETGDYKTLMEQKGYFYELKQIEQSVLS